MGTEFLVNSYTTGSQYYPALTTLKDGGFVISWQSDQQLLEGHLGGIYAQSYNADGTLRGAEFRINSDTSSAQYYPSIAMLEDGGFVATWVSHTNAHDGSSGGVYGQVYNADGTAQGAEFQVNSYTTGPQGEPVVSGLADGGFVVSWISYQQDGQGNGVFGQIYNGDGSARSTEFQINSYTDDDQLHPDISALKEGGFVVVWASEAQVGDIHGGYGTFSIFGQRYYSDGKVQGDEFQVNTFIRYNQNHPSVTGLVNGGFVVSWTSDNQDGDGYGVYGQMFKANGTPEGDEFLINSLTANGQDDVDITALAAGGFVATWTADHQDGGENGFYGVFGQKFNADGSADGDEFLVNSNTDWDQQFSAVSGLEGGGFVVTWASNDNGPDWDGYGVHGRIFEGSDDVVLTGTAQDDRLVAGIGDDLLRGLAGNDTLLGKAGNDRLEGGTGADLLQGGAGRDKLFGGAGNDRLAGGGAKDVLKGGAGRDKLFGGAGHDRLEGGGAKDILVGGNGRDKLFGNAGNDRLDGGRGGDKLFGGAGADIFVFKAKGGKDVIRDFQDDIDTIRLDDALWKGTLNKQQVIDKFANAVGDDIIFDFGKYELKIKGFNDLSELKDDMQII